jgi:hypothetical protein
MRMDNKAPEMCLERRGLSFFPALWYSESDC